MKINNYFYIKVYCSQQMIYIHTFNTKTEAVSSDDVINKTVVYCRENRQSLIGLNNVQWRKELSIIEKEESPNDLMLIKKKDYLTFTCIEAGGISLSNYGNNAPNIQYKKNDGTWITWDYSNIGLVAGDIVKMNGINSNGFSTSTANYSKFVMTGTIAADGNIMSLIDSEKNGTKIIPGNGFCFNKLFIDCISLTIAPELPATTLVQRCYNYMFDGCTSLTTAPILPATTLVDYCYYHMFSGCTSLMEAPELYATTLAGNCYQSMFRDCTSLIITPTLAATNLAPYCYQYMFRDCTSLTTVHVLPATTLAEYCYSNMFSGCTSLSYIKCLATNISAINCTDNWVTNVSNSGQFAVPNSMQSEWNSKTAGSGKPTNFVYVDA